MRSANRTALITGVTGQDGTLLAELLLGQGYLVWGATRDVHMTAGSLPSALQDQLKLVRWDARDGESITEMVRECRPSEIYNLAGYSSGAGMFDDPVGIAEANGLAVTRILDAILKVDTGIRLCQASSREIFGEATTSPQDESTLVNPRSPYGAAKQYADSMIRIYRRRYGIFACSAILFNHESPRRGLEFVTRKITREAVKIKLGLVNELHLGNLDAQRDWGYAGDYVRAMWLMLQQQSADDFVIATGEVHSVREFCELAFGRLDLDYQRYVQTDPLIYRPVEPAPLVGSAAKAARVLGWQPSIGFRELVYRMVDADLRSLNGKL